MKSILIVIKENRYSFSHIISIADFYCSNIEIVELKDNIASFNINSDIKPNSFLSSEFLDNSMKNNNLSNFINPKHLKTDNILYNSIEKQLEKYKKNIENSYGLKMFFFSIHSWYRKFFLLVFSILKKNYPDSIFIVGGPDVIAKPYLYAQYFDLVCNSEGESFLIDFFNGISSIKENSFIQISPNNISNCISKYSSLKLINNHNRYIIERNESAGFLVSKNNSIEIYKKFLKDFYQKYSDKLDLNKELLFKIYSKINLIKTQKEIFKYFPSFPLITSFFHPIEIIRGCPQGCKYCQASNIFGKDFRKKDIDIVKIFLKYQLKNKKNHIRFISPDFALFFIDKSDDFSEFNLIDLLNFIINESKKNKIEPFIYLGSFPSELSLRFLKKEYLDLISKYSATKKITIGIQTISRKLQKIIGRNDPLDKLQEVINYCKEINLEPIIDIIFGLPYETQEDRSHTMNFLEKNCSKDVTINLHYFLPLPGTDFENEKPTRLNSEEILRIKKFFGKGFVAGNFFKQMNDFSYRIEIPLDYLQNP